MSKTFAYARVPTAHQTAANQLIEIRSAGFAVKPHLIFVESISRLIAAVERPGFNKLLNKLEQDDVLIVTKLDRLGRNAMDVHATVERLATIGVGIHCLALEDGNLISAAGRRPISVLNAVAEYEHDLLIERTQAGLVRAKSEGQVLGQPTALIKADQAEVLMKLAAGVSVAQLARDYNTHEKHHARSKPYHTPLGSPQCLTISSNFKY